MAERIPREYHLPTLELPLEDYIPPRTRNQEEAQYRQEQAGTGALVLQEQADGIRVGKRVLERLEAATDIEDWANLLGGTALATANYMYKHDNPNVMHHNVKLPVIAVGNGIFHDHEKLQKKALFRLQNLADETEEVAELAREHRSITGRLVRLGRDTATAGAAVASYGIHLPAFIADDEVKSVSRALQHDALSRTDRAYRYALNLHREIGSLPSLAQFARRESALGLFIQQPQHGYSDAIDSVFSEEVQSR